VAIDYQKIKSWQFEERVHTYSIRDTLLYSLGVGVGFDPLDSDQLRYTYEEAVSALPSMALCSATMAFGSMIRPLASTGRPFST
jgi:hypothetical protein